VVAAEDLVVVAAEDLVEVAAEDLVEVALLSGKRRKTFSIEIKIVIQLTY